MLYLNCFAFAAIAYLLGGINGSIILSRLVYGEDIRQLGSKNPGFTNFKRIHGFAPATFGVMAIDICKTVLPVLAARLAIGYLHGEAQLGAAVALLGCMLGHAFPVWYGFKGGKAVLTFLAGVWFVNWLAGLVCFAIFVIILFTVRFMSVASMSFAVLFPVALFALGCRNPVTLVIMVLAGILVVIRHSPNISRLKAGTESKFYLKKKK
ncbi:MAG: glycerol-3-phosphate 1-O-acyltransferase PlsY [Clostridia bacterium]|nr:glycerol-3-phosphate 1-O-acyltransferase PlsY [Clostridia bacterium]